jgi:methionine-rich copper-binding protein CopC
MKHKLSIALLVALVSSLPANAHDEVVSQSPAQGEVVEAGQIEIRVQFSDTPISLEDGSGNEISVTLPDGSQLYSGCFPTESSFGVLPVDLDQAGTHRVSWRVVSSDGHPISSEFSFEVENTTGYVADPDFAYPPCGSEPNLIMAPAADFYWVLWLSLGVVAGIVFFIFRPKKRPQKGKES